MQLVYIGIDPATVCGVAIYYPEQNMARVMEVKGTPVEQLSTILEYLFKDIGEEKLLIFSMEKLHNFRNANTTRSLLERYGYLRHTLDSLGFPVRETSPASVRAHLQVKTKTELFDYLGSFYRGKHLTNNHTDALAIAIYQAWLDGLNFQPITFRIEDVTDEHVTR